MRRTDTVSVSGALLLALACIALISLWPDPVGAQADPLVDLEAEIEADRVLIAFPQGQTCSLDDDTPATITVEDGGTPPTSVTFTEGEDGATIAVVGNQIVVTVAELALTEGTGTVESSTGIVCTDDNTNPDTPTAPACPAGTDQVVTFSSDDTTLRPFRIDEEDFQVRYAVEAEQETETENESFEFSVRRGGDRVEQSGEVTVPVTDGVLEVDDEGPGTFRLVVVDQDVVFAITVCEGGAGGGDNNGGGDGNNNDDDGDVDDPDDVVPGTGDDDPLPDTGGAPLLFGAAALALAAALLARRILAP